MNSKVLASGIVTVNRWYPVAYRGYPQREIFKEILNITLFRVFRGFRGWITPVRIRTFLAADLSQRVVQGVEKPGEVAFFDDQRRLESQDITARAVFANQEAFVFEVL